MKHMDNVYMIFAWVTGIVLQALVTEIPYFVSLFGTSRLTLQEWGILGALSSLPLVVHELLVLSEGMMKRAETQGLEKANKGKNHENSRPQPGEVV